MANYSCKSFPLWP